MRHSRTEPRRILLGLALILAACGSSGSEADRPALPPNLLEEAIPVGEDLYMVPVGEDGDGCAQFTPYAVDGAAIAVIYYRDEDGGFTPDKAEAICR